MHHHHHHRHQKRDESRPDIGPKQQSSKAKQDTEMKPRDRTHMGDSCWPRDAQGAAAAYVGAVARKRGGAARATRQQKEAWRANDERTDRRERAPAQRPRSIAWDAARGGGGWNCSSASGEGLCVGDVTCVVSFFFFFFRLRPCSLLALCHAGQGRPGFGPRKGTSRKQKKK